MLYTSNLRKPLFLFILIFSISIPYNTILGQCGTNCTNPTGNVVVGWSSSICYDQNTTISTLQLYGDGIISICDNVILTVSGSVLSSGTSKIEMNNCSELKVNVISNSSNNVLVYKGDGACDARLTIQASSALGTSLTTDSNIHFCNPNNAANSGSPGNATVGCSTLPVDIIHFVAIIESTDNVILNWQTISEINNDYFTVERSTDGMEWISLTDIQGKELSNTLINYTYRDQHPVNTRSYYRIKQTDLNGDNSFSKIQSIHMDNIEKSILSVYPNPVVYGKLIVEGNMATIRSLNFYNILGQNINNSIVINKISNLKTSVDISMLENGTYIVKDHKNTKLFIKM